ncbi:low PSII accumulateion protein, chloroplastic [Raphidocelis subcapitata]|uniref:Low PSII accumulateion protein, chloroplastic n=1 Tax=Raphidocelis subcapitata TaxID=307507 RepID=A0A2V0NP62_9CHLO|nr:low PSII accumulateion protein, chloroplastic [Raphidocelis subcapitata]|eukprot:GBF88312.1 low PSII accumulateion protein, chloroplastic [Raphidocelis subcapitata]
MQAFAASGVQQRAVVAQRVAGVRRSARPLHVLASAGKGFGDNKQRQQQSPKEGGEEPSTSATATASGGLSSVDVDSALARRRNRGRIEARVQVESATVAQATGAAPQTEIGEFETAVVQALAGFFGILLVEGLVLAGAGFLPESWDSAVQAYLYPSFSPQMALFLAGSSAYGLWKTGKLPGQKQM